MTPETFRAARRAAQPRFRKAILADARITAERRSERSQFTSPLDTVVQVLRLMGQSDAYLAQVCYRAKVALQVRRIPVLPRILHRLAMATAQVSIGDPVIVEPGVYFPHGQVVIDGIVTVGSGTAISPWVTIGLRAGEFTGPTIGRNVRIGTGAKVLGGVTVGAGARIGANAVVLGDVPAGATAVGVPSRVIDEA